jgi:tetratricopeptide (TPR) repeat protein
VVAAFKNLRLQAIVFGVRALLESNNTRRALSILESHLLRSSGDAFDLSGAEDDPALRQYAVLAKLEYGVALAKAGRPVEGLDQIQQLIRKYRGGTGQEEAYLNDARKALAELAALGVKLRGEDYFESAMGLKGQLKWEEALGMFQQALAAVEPSGPADRSVQLACLNEIGECSFILARYTESAVAYKEAHDYFRDTGDDPILDKIAKNYLPAVNKSVEESGAGGPAWDSLSAEAEAFYNERIGGVGLEQLKMVEAGRLEDEGQFAEAREKYLSVARQTEDGVKVPFYWRAQASARMCLYKEWEAADADGKKELEPELEQALVELEKIVSDALSDDMGEGVRDTAGAATAALGIAQIHFAREPTDWQAIVDALEVFTGDLAGETSYRCMGLGYLILAGTRLGDCEDSLKRFLELRECEECTEDPVVGIAAQALSDCFYEAGDLKKAAVLILMWAKHPSAKEDLENPRVLLLVASRLIEGGMAARSVPYIKRMREKLAGDPELERQILILEAKRQTVAKDWNKVVEALEKYVADFDARGDHYEDPYVRKDLAEAYISRGKGKPTTKDALEAEKHYSTALYIINERLKKDPKLDRTFWLWSKRWLEINKFLGDAGQIDAYSKIVAFVDRFQHKDMGGLRDEFLKLSEYATSKLPAVPRSR